MERSEKISRQSIERLRSNTCTNAIVIGDGAGP